MSRAPDLVVLGRIASLAGESGFGWVEAMAVRDGLVVEIGARPEMERSVGRATRVVDLPPGHVVLPSVTDAHVHLVDAAMAADEIDLEGSPTLATALALVADAHAARLAGGDHDGWLLGHGWSTDGWDARPTAADLERVAPGRPIALWAHDHHTRWLSDAALRRLGIDAAVVDPLGGTVGRDDAGRPDGLLYEHATRIGADAIPRPGPEAMAGAVERYAGRLAALGVTGVHDPGGTSPDPSLDGGFATVRTMADEGCLPLRVHAGVRDEQLEAAIAAGYRSGASPAPPDGAGIAERQALARYRMGWLKLFGDGSVGSRTAAMLEPYEDAATRNGPAGPLGHLLESRERLTARVSLAAASGIATMIHAIGDRAVRTALDAFEAAGAERLAALGLRPRIEHAQLVQPSDRARFGTLGVVASLQPIQLRSDEATMQRAWGQRTALAFPLGSLVAAGAAIVFGTDAPVEPPDPWPGIATAVSRWAPEWGDSAAPSTPGEAISLDRAIRAATVGPWAAADDALGGRLVPGATADLVVLEWAPEAADASEQLRSARPALTLLDGTERHRAPGFDR